MIDYYLNALVTLFVTIDPPGLAPLFVVLTTGMGPADRRLTALRSTMIAAPVLIAFALIGEGLLGVLGISLSAFRIAGGLLLFWIAFEMIFAKREERKTEAAQKALGREDARHLAVFPLAIPLIAGPGAISATILLASQAPDALALTGLVVIIIGMIASCLAVFLLADQIDRVLGDTGRIVLSRLLGLILAALAVQFAADGVLAFVHAA